jgi:glycosyltransferase involved in cell wall biosynthesis
MSATCAPTSAELVVLGTLPPPVTGHTVLTEQVVRRIQSAGPVRFFNWSTGLSKKGFKFRTTRVLRVLQSLLHLLRRGRVRNQRLYLVANSTRFGLYLTALVVALARRLGYQLYLHHHSYLYIERHDWRMAYIDRRMSPGGVHVVHSEKMAADFQRRYDSLCGFRIVYPSVVKIPLGRPRPSPGRPFRIGHLSNLSIAKGLDLVIETFEALLRARDVRLELAGPVQKGRAQDALKAVVARHPTTVRYRGPLYGDDKLNFFEQIDAFVLPTRNESWGIVLHEALAAGVPVITFDRGCTQTVVGKGAGLVVSPDADFVQLASRQIERWIEREDEYSAVSQAAIDQAESLHREGERTATEFAAHVFS